LAQVDDSRIPFYKDQTSNIPETDNNPLDKSKVKRLTQEYNGDGMCIIPCRTSSNLLFIILEFNHKATTIKSLDQRHMVYRNPNNSTIYELLKALPTLGLDFQSSTRTT